MVIIMNNVSSIFIISSHKRYVSTKEAETSGKLERSISEKIIKGTLNYFKTEETMIMASSTL